LALDIGGFLCYVGAPLLVEQRDFIREIPRGNGQVHIRREERAVVISWRPWVVGALICAGTIGNAYAQDTVEQEAMAESLIAGAEAAAGRAFDPKYRARLKDDLAARSLDELAALPPGLVPRAFGDSADNLVFTPVVPCRIIDTRKVGGPLVAGVPRNFRATGVGFAGQGGDPGDCLVPNGPATAVFINFVAVGPQGPGHLTAFPFNTAPPNTTDPSSIINYSNVGLNIANGLAVPICKAPVLCTFDLTVTANSNTTHLVADVVGYFAAPVPPPTLWAVVNSNGVLRRSFHATSTSTTSTGFYQVIFDRNVSNCAYVATTEPFGQISVLSLAGNLNGVLVITLNGAGTLFQNLAFHLAVHCH
jgi:hypothetical protein